MVFSYVSIYLQYEEHEEHDSLENETDQHLLLLVFQRNEDGLK